MIVPTQYYKTEGLVIKKIPFGEADFLVRTITRDFGKMDCIAKGARRPSAKLNASLDIANRIRVMFFKNGERLPTMIDAESLNQYDHWFSDTVSASFAMRIMKIVEAMLPYGVNDPELYNLLVSFFEGRTSYENVSGYAQEFLNRLFAHEGYGDASHTDALPLDIREVIMKI